MSCNKVQVPEEILSFLYGCNIDDAMSFAKTLISENTNSVYDAEGNETEKTKTVIKVDRSDIDDYYLLKTVEYSGDSVLYDNEAKLFVYKAETSLSYDVSDALYVQKTEYTGKTDVDSTSMTTSIVTNKYRKSDVVDRDKTIFYTSVTEGKYNGGYYYADFFLSILSYVEHFSIEDNMFVYTLENQPYQSGKEKGTIDEVLKMNDKGLVVSMIQNGKNTTTGYRNESELKIQYNSTIDRN